MWVTAIIWGERFGQPPWVIYEQMSRFWYNRINAFDSVRGEFDEAKAIKAEVEARAKAKR